MTSCGDGMVHPVAFPRGLLKLIFIGRARNRRVLCLWETGSGTSYTGRTRGRVFRDVNCGMSFDAQEAVMNRTSTREEILQKGLVLLLSLVVPALAWGQHKPSGGGGGSHPSAPAKSAPAKSAPAHGAAQSHAST